jgi:hypothetical protein
MVETRTKFETAAKYIPTDSVNAFALLFRGNLTSHYVLSEHKKYHNVKGAASTVDYLRHLRRNYPSLLISPILPGGKCFLAALDLDRHGDDDTPVDCVALAKQVTRLHLSLIVTRSKNGRGAWLWLFFKEAEGFDAATAIRLMSLYRDALELPKDTEMFPKQSDLDEGKTGNGANLPLFGEEREAYGPDGEVLDLTGFLRLATERASYGCVLALRDLDVGLPGSEETFHGSEGEYRGRAIKGGVLAAENKLNEEHALPGTVLRTLYQQFLDKLVHAPKGTWTLSLNATAFFSGRSFAAHALDATEADTKDEIRKAARIARTVRQHPDSELDNILEKAWKDGMAKPFKLLDPQEEHDIAFRQIDALLHDDSLEVTVPKAVMFSAAKLDKLEYDTLRQRIAKRLKMSTEGLDKHVNACRPKAETEEPDELQGTAVIFTDIEPWPEPVDGAKLLDGLSTIFARYIHFGKSTDADALALWTLGTHCFDAFDIFPRIGMTSREENSGKSTVLKVLLRLVRRPLPGICPTAAVIFRGIEVFGFPTLILDEGDNSFYADENRELLAILNSGHERDLAFVQRTVGEEHTPRNFSTWAPMAYGMIGRPKRTLLSRSIEIRMLRAKADEVKEKLPRLRFTPPIFEELRRKCARWAADNVKTLAEVKVESSLINRAGDNWEPLLMMARLVEGTWPECTIVASQSYGDETAVKSDPHLLLRDIRNIFHTRKVESIAVGVLLADLLRQPESPWQRFDKGHELNVNILGRLLAEDGIVSKPRHLTKGQQQNFPNSEKRASVRVYERADFEELFSRFLTGEPENVEVSSPDPC